MLPSCHVFVLPAVTLLSWDLCRRFLRFLSPFSAAFAPKDPLLCTRQCPGAPADQFRPGHYCISSSAVGCCVLVSGALIGHNSWKLPTSSRPANQDPCCKTRHPNTATILSVFWPHTKRHTWQCASAPCASPKPGDVLRTYMAASRLIPRSYNEGLPPHADKKAKPSA